jgi:hypothetical protein
MAGSSKIKALTSSDANTLAGQPHSYYLDANNFTNMPPSDLSGDTTPQLGGNLDLNSNNVTGTGNINVTGTITGTSFSGPLTGNVTGNADTATTLATARNIAGVSFDGSSNISLASSNLSDGSSLATLTDTQTLTNKTINLSSNTLSGTTAQFNTALSDGSFRIGYQSGEIIETIACMCDGSTVSVQSGNYTITDCTAAQSSSTTYTVMTGSQIDYTPPAGTKRVLYRYNFKFDSTGYSSISHFKFQIDGTDVVPASRNYSSNYASSNWHHANLELGIEWVIDCDAASDDAANGKFTSWTSAKTLRGLHREYGGGYSHRLHGNVWWDGTSASGGYNNPIKPFLYIQAIA